LAYAKILDTDSVVDLETSQVSSALQTETYFARSRASKNPNETGTTITLSITPDGQVSEIAFKIIVL
ncbi:MAG: hypothetical protein AAFP03_12865, partial [Cyanobacteria bacterium J06598_3]